MSLERWKVCLATLVSVRGILESQQLVITANGLLDVISEQESLDGSRIILSISSGLHTPWHPLSSVTSFARLQMENCSQISVVLLNRPIVNAAVPTRASNLQEIKARLAVMSSEASRWYRALGHKGLLHDKLISSVLAHVSVLTGWCAKSFADLKDQIRDMNQRITQQQTTLVGEQARITLLYTAIEPLKNEFSSSRSILAIVQSHVSAAKGGLDRLQDTFGHLKSRFDGLQHRLTTSDNRIDELELQIKVLRSSMESLRQSGDSGGLAEKGSVEARLSSLEHEVRNSQTWTRASPPAFATVDTNRSVQCTLALEYSVKAEVSTEIKRLLNHQQSLEKKLDEQRRHLYDQITSLERRMTAEQASLKGREDLVRARLDALAVSNEASEVLKEAKALVQEKFKVIVDASKQKFDAHGDRIGALEKDIYKPSLALPVGERLDVLEYDVQQLTGKEKESAVELRNALENLNMLQGRMDNLRLDVKNAFKKVSTAEADRKTLDARDSAVQQLTTRLGVLEHDSLSHMDKMDYFQKRFEQVQRDCRQFLEKTQQLTESEGPRLNDLERFLQKATGIFSIGLVQIKQQVDSLEKEFEGVGNEVEESVANYLDLANSEHDQDPPSVSLSICSVEAVHDHVRQPYSTAEHASQPPDPEQVSDSPTSPGEKASYIGHRTIQEQGLAPLEMFAAASTRNVSLEHIQRSVDLMTDRCMTLEMKIERLGSLSDERLGDLHRAEVAEQVVTDLGHRVRLLEDGLQNSKLGDNIATTHGSTEPAWPQETALVQSAASALLTARSTFKPFSSDVLLSADEDGITDRLEDDEKEKALNPIRTLRTSSSLASKKNIQASVHPYGETTPSVSYHSQLGDQKTAIALVKASSIWSTSAEFDRTTALEGKLQRFEKDVNQQMSLFGANLEKTGTSLRDLTLLISSAYGPAMSGNQQATVLEILGPASDPSDSPSTASKGETTLPTTLNEVKATLTALKDNFERMNLIVNEDTQKLSSLQRRLDDTWKRQMATPTALRVNQLGDSIQQLTDRINTLEYNLRWRRLI